MAKYKQRADGRYCTNVDLGYDSNGNRLRKMVYGKSVRDLDLKVLALKTEIAAGHISRDHQTVGDYADMWLTTYKAHTELKTYKMYQSSIKYIKAEIGEIELIELRASDVQNLINANSEHRRTCEQIRLTMRQIISRAIDDNIITKDITRNIELPKKKKTEKRALTELEKEAIFKADFDDKDRAFIYILYYFGLRKEEALALTASDFDFKKRILHINRALQVGSNREETKIKETKNTSSIRDIPIPNAVFSILRDFCKSNKQLYLFADKNGNLPTISSFRRTWERILNKLNEAARTEKQKKYKINPINDLTAHIFRHNYATMLYYSDIGIKEASKLMGHSDTKMIMEVYAHLDDNKADVSTKLNNMFSGVQ